MAFPLLYQTLRRQPTQRRRGGDRFFSLKNELLPGLWDALDTVNTFYAVQGFRLGLKTGLALGDDLRS